MSVTSLAPRLPEPAARVPDPRIGPPITIERRPQVVNLLLYRGDDFALVIEVYGPDGEPADITGGTAVAEIKASPDAPGAVGSFAADVATYSAEGLIVLHLLSAVSFGLPPNSAYDCPLVIEGARTTLIAGTIGMMPNITGPVP
jgi:hypothetical protein